MKTKTVKQPIITKTEINKTKTYGHDIKLSGYRPWTTVRQSNTYGQGQIIYSHKTERDHHLFSRGERLPFLRFEHDPNVVDVLEQYPLPLQETLEIAAELNIVHPGSYKERAKYDGDIPAKTMTQDFVIVKKTDNGAFKHEAYSFKYQDTFDEEITSPRVIKRTLNKEKIAIELWRRRGIDHTRVTEQDYNPSITYNLEFLRECYDDPEDLDVSEDFFAIVIARFRHILKSQPSATFKQHIEVLAKDLGITPYQAKSLIQHAIYGRFIRVDLTQKIELYHPLPSLEVNRAR